MNPAEEVNRKTSGHSGLHDAGLTHANGDVIG